MIAMMGFAIMRKNVLLLIIGIFGFIIILAAVTVYFLLPLRAAALSKIQWNNNPPLLAFWNVGRFDRTGLLFVRARDSRELFFPGDWKIEKSNNAFYVFGEFPSDYKEARGQQLFFVSPESVHQVKLSLEGGQKITSVRENDKGTYFSLEITKENKSYYCIAKRVFPSDLSCQTLILNKRATARWNPDRERELVILTDDNTLFTYESELKRVKQDDDKDRYQQLSALFLPVPSDEYGQIWKFFNILVIQKAGNYAIYRIPLSVEQTHWLADDNHILLVSTNSVRIFEPSTSTYSPIITEEHIGNALATPL